MDSGISVVRKHMTLVLSSDTVTKRHAHDHDPPYNLPQLLGGLRDDPGIVSVKHASKRRRHDWLSGSCLLAPFFFLRYTKASMMSLSALKRVQATFITAAKKNVEQEGRGHAPLAKALIHSEPLRTHLVVELHACSHAIV